MGKRMEVPPVVAAILVVVVVAIAGLFLWRSTGPKGKVRVDSNKMKEAYGKAMGASEGRYVRPSGGPGQQMGGATR